MPRLIIGIILLLSIALICVPKNKPQLVYISTSGATTTMTPVAVESTFPDIDKINANAQRIQSLQCSVAMTIQKGMSFKAHGSLYYQHDKNFRLIASRRTTELDVGSNDALFWFWSKRMRPSNLYYCEHGSLTQSGLKTPFNPLWMMESMNIKGVDEKDIEVFQHGRNKIIRQLRVSASNELVIKETLIDTQRSLIMGHYLYDKNKRIIASTEIIDFQNVRGHVLRKSLNIIWHDERVQMTWVLSNVSINNSINPSIWQLPSKRPKVNLGSS